MRDDCSSRPIAAANLSALVLADGKVFYGNGIGHDDITVGEICFNTGITGYQEILTDLSYAGQIITFTFPHIGNVGANDEDIESKVPAVKGLVVREDITNPSNFRSQNHLNEWLKKHKITGISGIDTRSLTRYIRKSGAQNAAIGKVAGDEDVRKLAALAKSHFSMVGLDLAKDVTCEKSYIWNQTLWELGKGHGVQNKPKYKVVAVDYGAKLNIFRCLASVGCEVIVVPAQTSAREILSHKPDGVFLSNGPGDPAETSRYSSDIIREIIKAKVPIFGICLGHQLISLALGYKTEKMRQGHRGSNHPVKNMKTGKVEITSQNHGFVVVNDKDDVTHISLFDGTNEGVAMDNLFSVQHHPEASPGPHDSFYLFEQFTKLMDQKNAST